MGGEDNEDEIGLELRGGTNIVNEWRVSEGSQQGSACRSGSLSG